MQLGLNLGYWSRSRTTEDLHLVRTAEECGYSVAWVAEAYGSDAPSVLGWLAANTERIDLGSAIMQIPARSPAATAMTAATVDSLSNGRFRLGLGVSGPQVSEGWHGVRFTDPLGRTREYVEIVRAALRKERVEYSGKHFRLPLPEGPGKALSLSIPVPRKSLPIYLAAMGPRNLALAGQIADGWLAMFFSPQHAAAPLSVIAEGRSWGERTMDGFDVVATVPLSLGADPVAAAEPVRPHAALYLGGMGSRDRNFYLDQASRMGYGDQVRKVQDLFLDKQYSAAAAAVPFDFIDQTSLLGSPDRLAERIQEFAEAGVTTLSVQPVARTAEERLDAVRTVAEVAAGIDL